MSACRGVRRGACASSLACSGWRAARTPPPPARRLGRVCAAVRLCLCRRLLAARALLLTPPPPPAAALACTGRLRICRRSAGLLLRGCGLFAARAPPPRPPPAAALLAPLATAGWLRLCGCGQRRLVADGAPPPRPRLPAAPPPLLAARGAAARLPRVLAAAPQALAVLHHSIDRGQQALGGLGHPARGRRGQQRAGWGRPGPGLHRAATHPAGAERAMSAATRHSRQRALTCRRSP